ncbi:hypothetical protein NITHO_830007 [Nitrolancea hollandica Lb]|uniref:Uncharacterized protein n=1 Tax=Nitrolancea hollandica Lb TaxID=1129897 RepID=I4ENB5_9BACT|nr:hypothetical protein NITHO_830007 [Nitrolancea hollandica Lb]
MLCLQIVWRKLLNRFIHRAGAS